MIILVLALCGALSIVWMTLKNGISPMPSPKEARLAIVQMAAESVGPIYELGSGWGGLARELAKAFPERKVIAYENSPLPWLFSRCIQLLNRQANLELCLGDFWKSQLVDAKCVVFYQFRSGMPRIWKKMQAECEEHTPIISYCFSIPSIKADKTLYVGTILKQPIYRYVLNCEKLI